jgi:hypothetical protein
MALQFLSLTLEPRSMASLHRFFHRHRTKNNNLHGVGTRIKPKIIFHGASGDRNRILNKEQHRYHMCTRV